MGELIEALAIQTDNAELNSKYFIRPTQLLGCCEGLITYDRMSEEVGFAHFTVFEYLQEKHENDLLKTVELATVSLKYLIAVADPFEAGFKIERSKLVHRKFLEPACCYWGTWARGDSQNCPEFMELVFNLHESPHRLRKVHRLLSSCEITGVSPAECPCNRFTILHLLARGYLVRIIEVLFGISDDEDSNSRLSKRAAQADRIFALSEHCHENIDNVCDRYGSALHIAARNDDDQLFRLLIRRGANFNVTGDSNPDHTPIHEAAWSGSRSKLEFLHTQGANLSICNPRGVMPIYHAIHSGRTNCVELLLEKGCDVLDWKVKSSTPISLAAQFGDVKMLQILIKAAPALARGENLVKDSPLHRACLNHDTRNLKFLLTLPGMNPSGKPGIGTSPLHYAAYGYIEAAKALLDAGAGYTIVDEYGRTPLDSALLKGSLYVARVILDHSQMSNDSQGHKPGSTKSGVWELVQHDLLWRIEDNPQQPRYYKSLARTYLMDGNVEMASQYFDKYVHVLARYVGHERIVKPADGKIICLSEGDKDMWCVECHTLRRRSIRLCSSCERLHEVCEACFRQLLAHYPPKYFTDHIFHQIPSEQYPESISDFIKSFEARRAAIKKLNDETDSEDEMSEEESEDEISEDEMEVEDG